MSSLTTNKHETIKNLADPANIPKHADAPIEITRVYHYFLNEYKAVLGRDYRAEMRGSCLVITPSDPYRWSKLFSAGLRTLRQHHLLEGARSALIINKVNGYRVW